MASTGNAGARGTCPIRRRRSSPAGVALPRGLLISIDAIAVLPG